MEVFYFEPKELLPAVILDKASSTFQIVGTSCPMEPFEFFDPILNWFDNYCKDPLDETILELKFNYFNTSSSKFLLKILYKLEDINEMGHDVKIKWYYSEEDEDMLEEAEEFEEIINIDFDLIPVDDEFIDTETDQFHEIINSNRY